MAFCTICGGQMSESDVCPNCNPVAPAQTASPPPPPQAYTPQPQQPPQPQQQPYQPNQPQQPQQAYQPNPGYQQQPYQPGQPGQQQAYQPQQPQQAYQPQQGYAPKPAGDPDVQSNKIWAIVAYFAFFIPLIAGIHKTSPYAKYHINQGTTLGIIEYGYYILYIIITIVTPWWLWWLDLLLFFVSVPIIILAVMGIINAAQGKTTPLPVIGNFSFFKL